MSQEVPLSSNTSRLLMTTLLAGGLVAVAVPAGAVSPVWQSADGRSGGTQIKGW